MRTSKLEHDLTKGAIGAQILRLALPLLVGVIAAILVTTVDTFFVAFLGDAALAAIGYTFPVAMAGISLAFGLGIGAATIIGQEIGASRPQARVLLPFVSSRSARFLLQSYRQPAFSSPSLCFGLLV